MILIIAAVLKLISITQSARYLEQFDPLLAFLKNRHMLTLASLLELAVAAQLLSLTSFQKRQLLILWLGGVFAVYHLSLWALNYRKPCTCLGSVLDWAGVSEAWAHQVPIFLTFFLFAGSTTLLMSHLFVCGNDPNDTKHAQQET
ncbi:MAG: hypothetical protein HY043_13785 [Verrucomicrobia bacterium]|nr:hypothetical protein [Verrucomicrobiota bacterium]